MENDKQLIETYLNGTATDAEIQRVKQLMASDSAFALELETAMYVKAIQKKLAEQQTRSAISDAWDKRFQTDLHQHTGRSVNWLRVASVSAIVLLGAIGTYFMLCNQTIEGNPPPSHIESTKPAAPIQNSQATVSSGHQTQQAPEVSQPKELSKQSKKTNRKPSAAPVSAMSLIKQHIPEYASIELHFPESSKLRGATNSSANTEQNQVIAALKAYETQDYQSTIALLEDYNGQNLKRIAYLRALAYLQIGNWRDAKANAEIASNSPMFQVEAQWFAALADYGAGENIKGRLETFISEQHPFADDAKALLAQMK
jgi:hypothetical protein